MCDAILSTVNVWTYKLNDFITAEMCDDILSTANVWTYKLQKIKFIELYVFETNCTWDSIYVSP